MCTRNILNSQPSCISYDKNLFYNPKDGECIFINPEFSTKLNFSEFGRMGGIVMQWVEG